MLYGVQINECYAEKLAGCSFRTTTWRRSLRLWPVTHSLCLKTWCKLNTFHFARVSPLPGKKSPCHTSKYFKTQSTSLANLRRGEVSRKQSLIKFNTAKIFPKSHLGQKFLQVKQTRAGMRETETCCEAERLSKF